MNHRQKKIVITLCITVVILLIVCPLLLDAFIFGNNIPSNLDNGTWAGFLGSYLGAIIGGLVSLIGISVTILFTQNQNKEEREFQKEDQELQIRPYFDFMYNQTDRPTAYKKEIGYVAFRFDPDIENNQNREPHANGVLVLKNIGLGTAINCSVDYSVFDNERKRGPILFTIPKTIVGVKAFQPGEEGSITFYIELNCENFPKEKFMEVDGKRIPFEGANRKYPDFEIKLFFSYCDLLENKYTQELTFKSNIHLSYKLDKNEDGKYLCDMYLEDVTHPEKEKRRKRE